MAATTRLLDELPPLVTLGLDDRAQAGDERTMEMTSRRRPRTSALEVFVASCLFERGAQHLHVFACESAHVNVAGEIYAVEHARAVVAEQLAATANA